MTKRNVIALSGLLLACGLQAAQQQLAQRLEQLRKGSLGGASRVTPSMPSMAQIAPVSSHVASGESVISQAAQQAYNAANQPVAPEGWRNYLAQQASNVASTAGNKLSSWGNYLGSNIGYGWNRWKELPTGSVPTYLGQFGTGLAGYAANPYLAQSIAQRFPRASFVSDYPTTANAAALAATVGAGYGLKQLYNRYYQPAAVPLDIQISQLLSQEQLLDMQLNGEARYSTKAIGRYLLGYQGGLYNKLRNITDQSKSAPKEYIREDMKKYITELKEQIAAVENKLETVRAQIKQAFAAKVDEIVAQTPGSTAQKMNRLQEILKVASNDDFTTVLGRLLMTEKGVIQLPVYYSDIRFINALENKLA